MSVFGVPRRFPFRGRLTSLVLFLVVAAVPATAQTIAINPAISYPDDFAFTIDLAIDCLGEDVKGVEVVIAFDPLLLNLDDVTPGPWFTGNGSDYFFFDYSGIEPQGTIHFASSVLQGSNNQSAVIATCHFTAFGYGSTPLVFQDVDVRDVDNMPLVFEHSVGDHIYIDQAIKQAPVSFGALKAVYR